MGNNGQRPREKDRGEGERKNNEKSSKFQEVPRSSKPPTNVTLTVP